MGRSNLITKCFSIIILVLLVGIGIFPSIENIIKKKRIYLPDYIDPDWLSHDIDYSWYVTIEDNYDKIISPTWTFHTSIAWDVNEDKSIGAEDLSLLVNSYFVTGEPGWIGSDIDNDGEIGAVDLSLLVNHYFEIY